MSKCLKWSINYRLNFIWISELNFIPFWSQLIQMIPFQSKIPLSAGCLWSKKLLFSFKNSNFFGFSRTFLDQCSCSPHPTILSYTPLGISLVGVEFLRRLPPNFPDDDRQIQGFDWFQRHDEGVDVGVKNVVGVA